MPFVYVQSGTTIRYVDPKTNKVRRVSRYDLPVGHPARIACPPLRRRRRRLDPEQEALLIESQQE
jgi:hypothetical protein